LVSGVFAASLQDAKGILGRLTPGCTLRSPRRTKGSPGATFRSYLRGAFGLPSCGDE